LVWRSKLLLAVKGFCGDIGLLKVDLKLLFRSRLLQVGVIALALRLLVSPISANSWDMYLWLETAQNIVLKHQVFDFYTSNPSMHYALPPVWAFYLAAIYRLHPASSSDDLAFRFLAKLPMTVSDIVVAALAQRYVLAVTRDERKSTLAGILWLLNPHVFFISSIWGMPDSVCVMFLLLSIYLILTRRTTLAGLSYGLSVMTKHYSLLAYPLLLASILKRDRADFAKFLLASVAVMSLISLPFLIYDWDDYIVSLFLHTETHFPSLSKEMSGIYQLVSILHAWKKFRVPSLILNLGFILLAVLELLSFPLIYYSKMDQGAELNLCCLLPSASFVCLSLSVAPQYLVFPVVFLLIDVFLRNQNRLFIAVSAIPFLFYVAFCGFFHPPIYYAESVIREAADSVIGPFPLNVYINTVISVGFFLGYATYYAKALKAVSAGLAERIVPRQAS